MIFETCIPPHPLDKHVHSLIYFKDFIPQHTVERLVPTGHTFLVFELDGITRHTFDNETLQPNNTYTQAWVSGCHRDYISISAHENAEMLAIQFHAAGMAPFINMSADELSGRVVAANEIFGDIVLQLRDNLISASTPDDKFNLCNDWLLQHLQEDNTPPEELLAFIGQLQTEPVTNLDSMITAYPHTQQHLIRQFKTFVGITPKYYQRILRFNDILARIQHREKVAWSAIAYSCGFSDQSHFIKEFKHFSGFNPVEFIDNDYNKQETNFFPLK